MSSETDVKRIGAVWRVLIEGGAALGLIFAGQFVVLLVAIGSAIAAGNLTQRDLTDMPGMMSFINDASGLMLGVSVVAAGATTLCVWLAGRWLDKRPFADFGLRVDGAWWSDLAFGVGLGVVLMLLIFLVEMAAGWLTVSGTFAASSGGAFFPLILVPLATHIMVGFYEELQFRGYQFINIAEGLHQGVGRTPRGALLIAALISSVLFALGHGFNPNVSVLGLVNIGLAGLVFALSVALTGELALAIGLHFAWNFAQTAVFGFPVSGLPSAVSLIAVEQSGPAWLTGGAFGPEAGLLGTLALAVGSALIVWWAARRGGAAVQEGLAVYDS